MSSPSFARLKEAFAQLRSLDAARQKARLAELERDDPDLHDAVSSLLAHDASGAVQLVPSGTDVAGILAHLPDTAAPEPGFVGTRYEDRGLLGTGGMAQVRRVFDPVLHRTLAMKILRTELASDRDARARFVQESQIQAQLQHAGIVPIYDRGELPDGRPYLLMKEIGGRSMAEAITQLHDASVDRWRPTPGAWTLRSLVAAFARVCCAVEHAHSRGVVHGDLKPHNVMLEASGDAVVVDWGLARVLSPLERGPQTRGVDVVETAGSEVAPRRELVLGTPAFMAPERTCEDGAVCGVRSDIYALGAILYALLSGRPPYPADSTVKAPWAILREVERAPPAHPVGRADGPEAPRGLVSICQRAMARRPDDRYLRAADLASEVESWLEGARARNRVPWAMGASGFV